MMSLWDYVYRMSVDVESLMYYVGVINSDGKCSSQQTSNWKKDIYLHSPDKC